MSKRRKKPTKRRIPFRGKAIDEDVRFLAARFEKGDADERVLVVKRLGLTGHELATATLESALQDESEAVRVAAKKALRSFRERPATKNQPPIQLKKAPAKNRRPTWAVEHSPLVEHILASNAATLEAYKARPILVYEHANIERSTAQGGYGRRQLYELIQNGADALSGTRKGRIRVVLDDKALYCANEGEPVAKHGVDAILSSHISWKRGAQIGRFGLGFKSVLGVTQRPEFYSRTASFGFDAAWCRQEILEAVPDLTKYADDDRTPTLRLAHPLDADENAKTDPVLRELMEWATTIVKLPLTESDAKWLTEDLAQFPAEFMLFSPHVAELRLEDRTTYLDRVIQLELDGQVRRLIRGRDVSEWQVFVIPDYAPSPDALEDAGELAHRESVPLIWAVPLSGKARQARGRFWAFFPTEYETTLAGILNAPWKTNEDRQNLLRGPFNEELIDAAARIVVDNLEQLIDAEDPSYFLELLPGRGREAANWADDLVTESVYEFAGEVASLPDQDGRLRIPDELRIFPEDATNEALEIWEEYEGRPRDWCHHSMVGRDRRARALRLLPPPANYGSSVREWLEALVTDGRLEASASAIRVAAALDPEEDHEWGQIRSAEIVATDSGHLSAADPETVYLPNPLVTGSKGIQLVASPLMDDPIVVEALRELGFREADAIGELRSAIARGLNASTDWGAFWETSRRVDSAEATPLLLAARGKGQALHLRTVAGEFAPQDEVLLPGAIVPDDGSRDGEVAVDMSYHEPDVDLFRALGVVASPEAGGGSNSESWFGDYVREMKEAYYRELPAKSSKPQPQLLKFDRATFVGPLGALRHLSEAGKARLSEAVLAAAAADVATWTLQHETQGKYPKRPCPAPPLWLLQEEGVLPTSLGLLDVRLCVGPGLRDWSDFLPVVECGEAAAQAVGLPNSPNELSPSHWEAAFIAANGEGVEDRVMGRLYAEAAAYVPAPDRIRCRVGSRHELVIPDKVAVVFEQRQLAALIDKDMIPVLLAPSESLAQRLVDRWGLRPTEEHVRTEISFSPTAVGTPIGDQYPDLVLALDEEQLALRLQPCDALQMETITDSGKIAEDRDFIVDDNNVLFSETLDEPSLLAYLSEALGLGLLEQEIDGILENRETAKRRETLADVAAEADPASRLLRLIPAEAIRRRLPESLLHAVDQQQGGLDDAGVAELALAAFGVFTLRELRNELVEAGWSPPAVWSGSRAAVEFVTACGFDEAYAGFEQPRRRPALWTIDGPADLPEMHPFQRTIAQETRALLVGEGGLRGLLSLPTGAGKTRIAVQAIIEAIRDGDLIGPILWVAQTDELCEQAVQSWAFVWRAMGPTSQLHLSRLWASNESSPSLDGVQVVVATIAKLQTLFGKEQYEWLQDARCVVVDEAHGSTTPAYSGLLDWLGMARGKERVPLIGLTATPYRGISVVETERLVARYGRHRLDQGVFGDEDPYVALQEMGVLAKVDHALLKGSEIQLTEAELEELLRTNRLPSGVGQRVGADVARNEVLLESIASLPEDWPVLLFASAVDHAQAMAALLTLRGIPAAAISAQTEPAARRYYVERFREGDLRVLANYGVLTQGFDAPATRAVYVARPTFSPNLYQQMIGRGLRGPLNGGKDVCLIVNVADNIRQFGESLAFWEFEYLWDR